MAKTASVSNLGHAKEARIVTFKWIKALIGCMVVMGLAWPLTVIASYFTDVPDTAYYPIEVVLVLFIYWIAYAGYQKVILIYINPKVKANGLPTGETEALFGKLRQAMENEKLYLDPELNLNKVASHTGLSPKAISATLNQVHKTNFNDFINQYRIGEVKQKLVEPGHEHLTISGIAFETGFNSQATFQRAFKNSTGMSPREFINLHRKELTRQ
jgi:AraC-like DNA-binding protein